MKPRDGLDGALSSEETKKLPVASAPGIESTRRKENVPSISFSDNLLWYAAVKGVFDSSPDCNPARNGGESG